MQIRGIVKYLDPLEPHVIDSLTYITKQMLRSGALDYHEFKTWINKTNPAWNKYFNFAVLVKLWMSGVLWKISKGLFR